jgi:hypothetical protein
VKLNEDFRYRFKNGGEFSGRDSGFLVVESLEVPKKGDLSRLQLNLHVDFICAVLEVNQQQCFWLAESPSKRAREELTKIFPQHQVLNNSLFGYFNFDRKLISRFWSVFESIDRAEPWKNEAAWVLGDLVEQLPVPESDSFFRRPFWSVEHVLKNCEKINSLFVQSGWFAFVAIRPFDGARALVEREFPELKNI